MNKALVSEYIAAYKTHFHRINGHENYKWQAIKFFQDHWDIDAEDFPKMLELALNRSKNLMDSGKYYPKRMLLQYVKLETNEVRSLLRMLFDEEEDLYTRVREFKREIEEVHKRHFSAKNPFQDIRAIMLYLCLKYPDRYFLYKYEMYKNLAAKLQLPYSPKKGKVEELGNYIEVCKIIRHEISKDKELIAMHKDRLDIDCYADEELNVLTQDVIFAIDKHLETIESSFPYELGKAEENETGDMSSAPRSPDSFSGKKINRIENEKEKNRIGHLGELWVLKYEENRLRDQGLSHKIRDLKHISKLEGDGTGYDILSFDKLGTIFIEVKTTTTGRDTPFVVTRTELERSKKEEGRYRLYRLYNFEEDANRADLLILKGSLEDLCTEPERYSVKLIERLR
jgi:hypothetical protein